MCTCLCALCVCVLSALHMMQWHIYRNLYRGPNSVPAGHYLKTLHGPRISPQALVKKIRHGQKHQETSRNIKKQDRNMTTSAKFHLGWQSFGFNVFAYVMSHESCHFSWISWISLLWPLAAGCRFCDIHSERNFSCASDGVLAQRQLQWPWADLDLERDCNDLDLWSFSQTRSRTCCWVAK